MNGHCYYKPCVSVHIPAYGVQFCVSNMQKNILKYVSFKLAAFQRMTHISVAYYSRRLAQVVNTLLVHIDSTKEIRGQLCNCSHSNETVGSYQPFHD